MKFYECKQCGLILGEVRQGAHPSCCGSQMTVIDPGMSDGAAEKHVPVYQLEGNKVIVTVGEVEHPMLDVHYIEWIAIETNQGVQRRKLKPGEKPTRSFMLLDGENVVAVYAYCNLHSLWKK